MSNRTDDDGTGSDDEIPELGPVGEDPFDGDDANAARPDLPGDLERHDDGDDGLLPDYINPEDVPTPDPVVRDIGVDETVLEKPHHAGRYHLPSPREACQCGAWESAADDETDVDCDCVEDEDGRPVRTTVASIKSTVEAAGMDIDGSRATLYGVVINVDSPAAAADPRVKVTIADVHGVTRVQLMGVDLSLGDKVVITDVERHADDDWPPLKLTEDTHIETVVDGDATCLVERSALNRAPEVFVERESVTAARNWMADEIIDEYHVEVPHGSEDMMMYVDDEDNDNYGLFVGNAETRIKEVIDEYLPPAACNTQNKGQIVSLIQDRTRVAEDAHEPGAPSNEARRWSVAVKNGVVDLRTGELHEHDPAWRCTHKLPVEYHPGKYDGLGDNWDAFIDEITKEETDKRTVLYMIAHALTRCYPVGAIFVGIGPGGNGKSTLSKAIKSLIGKDAVGSWSMATLCGDYDFGAGPFRDRHLAIDDDATSVKIGDITPVKRLSGGEEAQMNIKRVQMDGYDNYATVVVWTNDPPIIGDKSDAVRRRMHPILMPNKFKTDPDPDDEFERQRRPEEEVLAELREDEELEALLAVAVRLAGEMHDKSSMTTGRSEDERWDIYTQYSDSVLQFWGDVMTQSRGSRVPVSVVYEIYVRWCDANGIDPVSNKGQANFWSLSDQCPTISYKRDGIWTDDERAVEHVALTDEAMTYAPEWVQDQWGDSIEETDSDDSTMANRLDRRTPLADLSSPGPVTVEAQVRKRNDFETKRGPAVALRVEDATHGIKVIEYVGESGDAMLDGVETTDEIRLERAILTKSKRGEPQLQVERGYTEVLITSPGALKEADGRHIDADSDNVSDDGDETVNDDGNEIRDAVLNQLEVRRIRESDCGPGIDESRLAGAVSNRIGASPDEIDECIEQLIEADELTRPREGYVDTPNEEVDG